MLWPWYVAFRRLYEPKGGEGQPSAAETFLDGADPKRCAMGYFRNGKWGYGVGVALLGLPSHVLTMEGLSPTTMAT